MDIARLFDVSGKTALVSGGSGGIGFMIADGLLRAGCKVFIVSRKLAGVTAGAGSLRPSAPSCRSLPISGPRKVSPRSTPPDRSTS